MTVRGSVSLWGLSVCLYVSLWGLFAGLCCCLWGPLWGCIILVCGYVCGNLSSVELLFVCGSLFGSICEANLWLSVVLWECLWFCLWW